MTAGKHRDLHESLGPARHNPGVGIMTTFMVERAVIRCSAGELREVRHADGVTGGDVAGHGGAMRDGEVEMGKELLGLGETLLVGQERRCRGRVAAHLGGVEDVVGPSKDLLRGRCAVFPVLPMSMLDILPAVLEGFSLRD